MIPRMLKLARQADVIHLNSVKLALPSIAVSIAGYKALYHLHELPVRIGLILRTAIGRAECAAFCSNTCAGHFATVPAKKKIVLVNAVPLPAELERPESKGLAKIVMLGSINHGKGQDLLLDAFLHVKAAAELHFYGNVGLSARDYARTLKEKAVGEKLCGKVFFHPPTDDVSGVLAETDVLVHTSRRESFGMVLVEAMAAGVPVIANDLGGMREVVADGVNGYLVPPGDATTLAGRIDQLLADDGLRKSMGAAGRKRVLEKFDIATRIEDYHKLYENLAESGE
jgi:glycosyltransferase involved in cell wall biosynthesis